MVSPAAAPKPSSSTPKPKPKPSPPPYYFNDCSQGICSPYCLQWCASSNSDDYFLPPPSDPSSSSPSVSPLLIALICVLSAAFLLLSYYTFASKLCKRRRYGRSQNDVVDEERHLQSRIDQLVLQDRLGASVQIETPPADNSDGGLDERFIKSITVFKYKRGDGLVESTDCAVCLTEFAEGESLRLMPNCQHAFHPPCIDTWLRSHSNCPICRALMTGAPPPAAPSAAVSRMRVQRGGDAVVVVDAGVHLSVRGEIFSDWRESDRRRQLLTATVTEEEEGVGEKEKGRR